MRLIDGDELLKKLVFIPSDMFTDRIREIVKDAPTVDAEPVRHGKWIKTFRYIGENVNTGEPEEIYAHDCSICGWHTGNQGKYFNYCPNCGAKMDGDFL